MQQSQNSQKIPIYSKVWSQFKKFPHSLATGAQDHPQVSGPAAAALISAAFSCFLLMVNQHFTVLFKGWNDLVWTLGSWIPGSKNPDPLYGEIGSYSGKETIMLVSWVVSWLILHYCWKDRQIQAQTMFSSLLFLLVAATVMNWHPIFPYLPLMPH